MENSTNANFKRIRYRWYHTEITVALKFFLSSKWSASVEFLVIISTESRLYFCRHTKFLQDLGPFLWHTTKTRNPSSVIRQPSTNQASIFLMIFDVRRFSLFSSNHHFNTCRPVAIARSLHYSQRCAYWYFESLSLLCEASSRILSMNATRPIATVTRL